MKKSLKTRKQLEKIYDHLYEFKYVGDRLKCSYCGDVRYCLDHCPPISFVEKIGTQKLRELKIELLKFPSCNFCNSALNAKNLFTYQERLYFMYQYVQSKIENSSIWSKDEIDDLGRNLKQMVMARQLQIRNEFINRLRGIERNIIAIDR